MGWGHGKFPIFTQLNAITGSSSNRDTVHDYFVAKFGENGENYGLGDLCYDWKPGSVPNPPWQTGGYVPADASEWKDHCQNDLNVPNTGQGGTAGNTVAQDLSQWVKAALLAKEKVVYRFLRDDTLGQDGGPAWKADLTKTGGKGTVQKWHITVTGPGF